MLCTCTRDEEYSTRLVRRRRHCNSNETKFQQHSDCLHSVELQTGPVHTLSTTSGR